ncbi:MAG: hypothetical protein ABH857_03830 [Elusimicrobiota bacterium]
MKKISLIIIAVFLFNSFSFSAELVTVADAQVLGGQYVFEGAPGTFGGIINFDFVPAIKFTDTFALVPSYYLNYKGTKDASELAGGDTLFQQSMDHTVIVKAVKKLNNGFKVKPRVSYRMEWLIETTDEKWGEGLFDYTKTSGGVEFEKEFSEGKMNNLSFSYDYYAIVFPNYAALSTEYGAELAGATGANVLDFNTNEIGLSSKWKLSDSVYGMLNYTIGLKAFVDQNIVEETGLYINDLRKDTANMILLNFSMPKQNIIYGIDYLYSSYGSTQNHYDATYLKYIPDYYDYKEHSFGPSCRFKIGSAPWTCYASYMLRLRNYDGRLIQDTVGDYGEDNVNVTAHSIILTTEVPVSTSLVFRTSLSYSAQASNMKYEQTYRYNFNTFNYFFGLGWKY